MNKTIVLPIKPEYAGKIFAGVKSYEYRTRVPKEDIKRIIFYITNPIKKILGEAEIEEVLMLPPEKLWEQTKNQSGISKTFFDAYFNGRSVAYAYKLGKVKVYEQPKELIDFGLKSAPQSFVYIKKNKNEKNKSRQTRRD